MIKANRETEFPAYVSDYLPTFLEVIGMQHPQPSWPSDGISLLPLIRQAAREFQQRAEDRLAGPGSTAAMLVANRSKPLGFKVGTQEAWIDGDWKLLAYPHKGQCKVMYPPYDKPNATDGTFLFNLRSDPTESHDLSAAEPERFKSMSAAMAAWTQSVLASQVNESECADGGGGGGGGGPSPPAPLPPAPVPAAGFALKHGPDCLTLDSAAVVKEKYHAMLGACDQGSRWDTTEPDPEWTTANAAATGVENVVNLLLKAGDNLLKLDKRGGQKMCALGNDILTGELKGGNAFTLSTVGSAKLLAAASCPAMYAGACKSGQDICLVARSEAMEFTMVKADISRSASDGNIPMIKSDDEQTPPPAKTWAVVNAAALSGGDFKDAAVAYLAEQGPIVWQVCRDLCAKNSSCTAFDHVGASLSQHTDGGPVSIEEGLPGLAGLRQGQCWFRLDGVWNPSPNHNKNHTSGHLVAPAPPVPKPPPGAKNVLFIIFDDYRAMHKVYGWDQPHLPNADGLAKESLVFDRAFVQQAVCGPSRASLMSGRRPDRTQVGAGIVRSYLGCSSPLTTACPLAAPCRCGILKGASAQLPGLTNGAPSQSGFGSTGIIRPVRENSTTQGTPPILTRRAGLSRAARPISRTLVRASAQCQSLCLPKLRRLVTVVAAAST
jgi:hypothetical protein